MLPRQFADNRIYDISREIKRIKKRGRHHSKDVGASNRHNLRLHRILGTRQKRAVYNRNHRPSEIFWRNDRLFARHCRLILKKKHSTSAFLLLTFLEQVVPDTVIREPDHAIYNDRAIWMKNKEGTAWNKTQCTFGT